MPRRAGRHTAASQASVSSDEQELEGAPLLPVARNAGDEGDEGDEGDAGRGAGKTSGRSGWYPARRGSGTGLRMLALARPEWATLCGAFACQLLQVAGEVFQPIIAGLVIDIVAKHPRGGGGGGGSESWLLAWFCTLDMWPCSDPTSTLRTTMLCATVLACWTAVFTCGASMLKRVAGASMLFRLRTLLFGTILAQPLEFYDRADTGDLVSRLSADVQGVSDLVTYELLQRVADLPTIVGCTAYIAYLSLELTLVLYAVSPAVALAGKVFGRVYQQQSVRAQDALAFSTSVATETFANIETVKCFSSEGAHRAAHHGACGRAYAQDYAKAKARGCFRAFTTVAEWAGVGAILWFGGNMVLEDKLSPGEFVTFVLFSSRIQTNTTDLLGLYASFRGNVT